MASFTYRARDHKGNAREGTIEAETRDAALQQLRREGLQMVDLEEYAENTVLFPRRVKKAEIVYVTSQLAIMVDTGINLATALAGICDQVENPTLRAVLMDLRKNVESGQDFSSCLAQHPKYFDRTFIALVKASEQTGSLGTMLDQIAAHMTHEMDARRKVRAAMAYPLFMLVLAIAVTAFLLVYVMPKFEPLFNRKGVQLPTPTIIMLGVSDVLIGYWWAWLLGCIALVTAVIMAHRSEQGKEWIDSAKIQLPLLGPVVRKAALSRSVRTLGMMVRNGVSMLEAIRLCAEVSGNRRYEKVWRHVLEEITKGSRICEALRSEPLVPKTLVQMIGSGEETGKLDYVLEKVSAHYDKEVESSIKTATSLIEPLMITVMGVVVGGIGMALLLPIFTLSRSAH